MVSEQKKVLIKALKNYGVDKQLLICEEEAAELIQAITKMQRYPDDLNRRDNLIEEMADVLICLEYLKLIYIIDDAEVDKQMNGKVKRIKNRMAMGL